jgi:hypothetical protein
MLKAADRCFVNDAIAPQDVLPSHVEATYRRLGPGPLVLAVQDTTEVGWTAKSVFKKLSWLPFSGP